MPVTSARIAEPLARPETFPHMPCDFSAQEPESQPPWAATLLVISSLKRLLVHRRFCLISFPFALTALAELQRTRSVEPSAIVTVPAPDHRPDNPRKGPVGLEFTYPCAGASNATTLHRPSASFKQCFSMNLAFQVAQPVLPNGRELYPSTPQPFVSLPGSRSP